MPHKKPQLPKPDSPTFNRVVKQVVVYIMGWRGHGSTLPLHGLAAVVVTAAPTADEYNALLGDVDLLRVRLNELIEQVGD
jgi:hypothetical protein